MKKIQITESQLRGLVKRMVMEEVIPKTGFDSDNMKNKIDVTDSDLMLARRLENYLDVMSVEIQPTMRTSSSSKPYDFKGGKTLSFKVDLGGINSNLYSDIKERIDKIKKFFSAKPNNYELLPYDSIFTIDKRGDNMFILFYVSDIKGGMYGNRVRSREKDMYSEPMGKKRKEGGFYPYNPERERSL